MLRFSPFTQRFTALTLLLLFLQVTVGQCLCAAAVGPWASPAARQHEHRPAPPTHSGCHGHALAEHHAPGKHHHGPARPDNCCKDKSAAILKALTTPPTAKLALDGPFVLGLPPGQDFTFARSAAWSPELAVVLVPPHYLPPKIPDIRVFLRSLTV